MKKPALFVSTLFLVLFTMWQPATAVEATPQGYVLTCRGGGSLYFNYTPFSNFSPNPQLWITFERGMAGVGTSWSNINVLHPGQCSWIDRGVASNEPNRIIVLTPILGNNSFSISWTQGKVMGVSSELYYINGLFDPSNYQSFLVSNDGKGNFVVGRIEQSTYHPGSPQLLSPPEKAVFSNFPRLTNAAWAPVSNAASYTVEVDCFGCCRPGWWCTDCGNPSSLYTGIHATNFTFNFVGAQPGRWRVWAEYANGHEGPRSEWREFRYTK